MLSYYLFEYTYNSQRNEGIKIRGFAEREPVFGVNRRMKRMDNSFRSFNTEQLKGNSSTRKKLADKKRDDL